MNRLSFSKEDRLLNRSQFLGLSKDGKRVHAKHFLTIYRENRCERSRLGITVSKKVGRSVERNRIKRLIREYFRQNRDKLPGTFDLNIIAKKGAADLSSRQVDQSLEGLFRKISLEFSE